MKVHYEGQTACYEGHPVVIDWVWNGRAYVATTDGSKPFGYSTSPGARANGAPPVVHSALGIVMLNELDFPESKLFAIHRGAAIAAELGVAVDN